MRIALAIWVFFIFCNGLYAQPGKKFISAGVGYAMPVGEFSQTYFSSNGINLHLINFDYLFSKHIGMRMSWHSSIHPNNNQAPEPSFTPPNAAGFTQKTVRSDYWYSGYFLAGPVLVKSKGKFDFQLNLSGGLAYLFPPDVRIDMNLPNIPDLLSVKMKAEESNAFVVGVSFVVRYTTGSKLSYYFSADYTTSEHEITYQFSNGGYEEERRFSIKPEIFSLNAGLGYRIK